MVGYHSRMNQQVSIGIRNDRTRPHVVWIEPWGGDFTILAGQRMTVITTGPGSGSGPWFILVENEYNTQVYVERGEYPEVILDGEVVDVGHNRQAAIDAGVYIDAENYMGQ